MEPVNVFIDEEDAREFIALVQRLVAEKVGLTLYATTFWDQDLKMYRVVFEVMSTLN